MAANPEIVALWHEMRLDADGKYVPAHRDGRPFTAAEIDLLLNATEDDLRQAAALDAAEAEKLDAARRDLERLLALVAATGRSSVTLALPAMGRDQRAEAVELMKRLRAAGALTTGVVQ